MFQVHKQLKQKDQPRSIMINQNQPRSTKINQDQPQDNFSVLIYVKILDFNYCKTLPRWMVYNCSPWAPTSPLIACNDLLDLLQFSPLHKTHLERAELPRDEAETKETKETDFPTAIQMFQGRYGGNRVLSLAEGIFCHGKMLL